MLELHIWGPAFGLPSIDPECLSALSYLAYAVPREDWTLIASNDVTVSPDHILPALHHNGTWTSGYLNIVSYLAKHTSYSTGGDLSSSQRADTLAYASYLNSRGSALLATALYASPSAWSEVTRPAYSSLLPFPLTWTVPLNLRSAAIAKTEQLGLDWAVDIDCEDVANDPKTMDPKTMDPKTMAPTTSTGFLRLPARPTLSSTWQPEQATAIRLHKLVDDFFSILSHFRSGNDFFLGSETPTSLDFLAFGYLKLMRVKTPHPFLANHMDKTSTGAQLKDFLTIMQDGPIRWRQDTVEQALPWRDLGPRTFVGTAGRLGDAVAGNMPGVVSESWNRWRYGGIKDEKDDNESWDLQQVVSAIGGTVIGAAALGGAVLFRVLWPFGAATHRFETPREMVGLYRFGDIGAMFDDLPRFEGAGPGVSGVGV